MVRFEWDEAKRVKNISRHGIDFAQLHTLFDFDRFLFEDDRFDYGDKRRVSIGVLFGEILAVTHTENDEVIRIITARKANKHEQEIYFKNIRD